MPEIESGNWPKRVQLILASRSPRRRQLLAEAGYRFEVIIPSDQAEEESLQPGETAAELAARLAWQKAADVTRRIAARFPRPSCYPLGEQLLPDRASQPPVQQAVADFTRPVLAGQAGADSGSPLSAERAPPHPPTQPESASPIQAIVIGCDTVVECQGQILGKPHDCQHARKILETLSGQEHWVYSGLCLWPLPVGQPQCRTAASRLRMDPLRPDQLEEYLQSGQWQGKAGAFGYQDRLGWVHLLEGSESNVVGLPLELLEEMLVQMLTSKPAPS